MIGVSTDPENREPDATSELFPLVYEELKRLARHHRYSVSEPETLCTTELVHEAFLKLSGDAHNRWQDRNHFFGAASKAMRQVLIDYARRRQAEKRGGDRIPISLHEDTIAVEVQLDEILEIDAALERLDAVDPRLREVVELRFFAGLSEDDIAAMQGVSTRTVGRDWMKARLFLLREMESARATTPATSKQ
jgi:RNA polymerase sigma factor (TIGR02999 family)